MYGVIKAEVFRPNYSTNDLAYLAMGILMGARKPDIYKRPWVARITGTDPKWGFKREFMRGVNEYAESNNVGSRKMRYYHVPPGIYEVCRHVTWTRYEQFFCRVDENGEVEKISREKVMEAINATH